MSTIYYLNANDFGQEGNHLAANIGGISFIMFHSRKCGHCVNFLPEFKRLPGSIRGVNFGLCSVDDNNRSIVQMSGQSSTPITAVPKFILYNDGVPYVEYSGQRSRQAIIGFLQEIIGKLNQKQTFTTRPPRSRQQASPQQQQMPSQQGAPSMPSRPAGMGGGGNYNQPQQQQQQNTPYKLTPSTGVKEYETSYGRPYNTLNENDFLDYEMAYKQRMNGK